MFLLDKTLSNILPNKNILILNLGWLSHNSMIVTQPIIKNALFFNVKILENQTEQKNITVAVQEASTHF